ncbi:WD40/YVTN/BNR-like repeat-containing protein [Marinospirillum sp.]|uniref:WD40/YVTN/BNR-like repeat-containing protein n=1 Tax=Marinospirillum sp. TaxID=2183934 RepID=UPI003A882E5D
MQQLFSRCLVFMMLLGLLFPSVASAQQQLLRPAFPSALAASSLLLDITAAGERLISVGERGHIVFQDPQQDWQQAEVPVIAHLTGVDFANDQLGFAVGHEGIILRTQDQGAHWELVHHELTAAPVRAEAKLPELELALEQAQEAEDLVDIEFLEEKLDLLYFALEAEEVSPLLDILMISPNQGLAVGGYNLALMTEDGGAHWTLISDRIPNWEARHLNAISQDPQGVLYIAGEGGVVFRSEDQGESWEDISVDYDGSLFGVIATEDRLFAFGLRGHLFISDSAGASWEEVPTPTEQTLNAGLILGERLLLVGQSGLYLYGEPHQLEALQLPQRQSLVSVIAQGQQVIAVGRSGVHRLMIPHDADSL